MITYLIHTSSIWAVLYITYKVLLSKEKYFVLNRGYLLFSLALGLLLPLVQFINFSTDQMIPEISSLYHQQVDYISQLTTSVSTVTTESTSINWTSILFVLISLGMTLMFIRNVIAGFKIRSLYLGSEKYRHVEFTEVRTKKDHLPFSFFRYIFFSTVKLKEEDRLTILNHEIHHVRAKHTWDVLFVEAIKVFFWWNPLVYLYKKAITENHEYAADHAAIKQGSRKEYCALLLQSNMPGINLGIGHPFFQTYIKKRIDMMYRKNSSWRSYLKFLLPALAIVFMAFVIKEDKYELDYLLDSYNIDLFVDSDYLESGVDYTIDRIRKKVVITNPKYTSPYGRSYCMHAVYETKNKSSVQNAQNQKTNDRKKDKNENIPSISPLAPKTVLNKKGQNTGYGIRMHPIHKVDKFHKGIDLVAHLGTPVFVTADGTVTQVQSNKGGYGKHIVIDHGNGYTTLYAHLNSFNIRVNDKVELGQKIGSVGSTGASSSPHLHYEVRLDDKAVDPENYGAIAFDNAKEGSLPKKDESGMIKKVDKQKIIEGAKKMFGLKEILQFEESNEKQKSVETYANKFGVVNPEEEFWSFIPMLGFPKDSYDEGMDISVTYNDRPLTEYVDYVVDVERDELIELLKDYDKDKVVVGCNMYNTPSMWRRKTRDWEYGNGGNIIRLGISVTNPEKLYVGLEDGTKLIQGVDYNYTASKGFVQITNQEIIDDAPKLEILNSRDETDAFERKVQENINLLKTKGDLFGIDKSMGEKDVIKLGANVKDQILVTVNGEALTEGEDYILNRKSGELRIKNSKFLKGYSINVEFVADKFNGIEYSLTGKADIAKTVKSDMVYSSNCKS